MKNNFSWLNNPEIEISTIIQVWYSLNPCQTKPVLVLGACSQLVVKPECVYRTNVCVWANETCIISSTSSYEHFLLFLYNFRTMSHQNPEEQLVWWDPLRPLHQTLFHWFDLFLNVCTLQKNHACFSIFIQTSLIVFKCCFYLPWKDKIILFADICCKQANLLFRCLYRDV